jgi:O-antigen/teichoic acid export membrane protein
MIKHLVYRWTKHRDRIVRLSREGGWIVLGQIASVVGLLVSVRVLTEYLNPDQYGELALGLTVASLANQFIFGGIGAGIGRFYAIASEKGDLKGYLNASLQLMAYGTMALLLLGLFAIGGLSIIEQVHLVGLVSAALIFSTFSAYNATLNGVQNAARQRIIVALHSGIIVWLNIGLAILAIRWLGESSTSVIIGYTFSALLVTASQLLFLNRLMKYQGILHSNRTQENWIKPIWQFSWPFCFFGIFTWMQQVSDRWALQHFASMGDVGQYAVIFQFGYAPITLVMGLVTTLIAPILYQRSGAATDQTRNALVHHSSWRMTQVSLGITAIAAAFTWLFHDWLFRWLVAEAFRDVSNLLPWVVLAGGIFASGQILSLKLMSEIRSDSLLLVKIVTALIGIGANILGAWRYGVEGVVGALVLFSLIYLVWMFFLAQHIPNQPQSVT